MKEVNLFETPFIKAGKLIFVSQQLAHHIKDNMMFAYRVPEDLTIELERLVKQQMGDTPCEITIEPIRIKVEYKKND